MTTPSESSVAEITAASQPTPPYSAFTGWKKATILAVSTFCGFASPLSATIFLPALDDLALDYHVSISEINLLVTVYLIFQAVGPMFVTNFAERAGYRPANILCLALYVIANIGLAVQNSYAAFIVLRCLQSFGSAVIALRNAVIASIIPPAERGSATAIVGLGMLIGPAFGPLIGAGFTVTVGWRWIFWFLAILSGVALVLQTVFIPETNRTLVGDGSIPPPEYEWWNRTPLDIKRTRPVDKQNYLKEREQAGLPPRQSPGWPDPRAGLKIVLEKDTSIVMLANALNFAILYCLMVSLPTLFAQTYGLSTLGISLCYVAIAGGAGLSLFLSGKLLNWNFRRLAIQQGLPVEKRQAQELRRYPVERARLQMILPIMAMGVAALVSYGWALRYAAPLGVSIFLLVLIGIAVAYSFNSLNNLLIDLYPTAPSNITAASNLIRCLLGAAGTASVNPLINAMGVGWCYTFIGGLVVVAIPLLLLEMRKGPYWREERFRRLERLRQHELR
ncbi:chloramphenicol resistance protein [Xylariales sp. PMI_506]|nr:chloramphenicol resistance protein [Xylariales sp. PMI_506]